LRKQSLTERSCKKRADDLLLLIEKDQPQTHSDLFALCKSQIDERQWVEIPRGHLGSLPRHTTTPNQTTKSARKASALCSFARAGCASKGNVKTS